MTNLPERVDFIVAGAGVAGLRAAITLAEAGTVLVLAKQDLNESATQYAQGGIAAALSDEDEIGLHLQDTIQAGDGLVNEDAARVLVEEGPERIHELIAWGAEFDRVGSKLTFTREAAHSRSRILHAHGDSTGREIGRALYEKAATLPNILFSPFEFTVDLLVRSGRVRGVDLIDPGGGRRMVAASSVLLATGGAGQVYSDTTNPPGATADGIAMAARAGAEISDMEFVQFHPTALYVKNAPRFLLSEALRGEGAILRNSQMRRFMPEYHEMAEMAPRDVVARAIDHELGISDMDDPVAYLDLTHLDARHIRARFPRIHETCLRYHVDIATDKIPVRPAAHYLMGGVRTDLHGRASLRGLYAAGETACTGVHGANRLASNSLLEGLVFGARAAMAMRREMGHAREPFRRDGETAPSAAASPELGEDVEKLIATMRAILWNEAGIVRSGAGLAECLQDLGTIAERLPPPVSRRCCEARNIHAAAVLITRSALARLESRGAHYRADCPAHDDAKFKKHSIVTDQAVSFK